MAKVELYTTTLCPYCWRAKRLLDRKGVSYTEYDLWGRSGRREEMLSRAEGRHTVPQIFINDRGIGGSDDLADLEERGELDTLLAADSQAA
ncbi:MAG: glutaredoxin 3 [Pseudomonadota bacterium]